MLFDPLHCRSSFCNADHGVDELCDFSVCCLAVAHEVAPVDREFGCIRAFAYGHADADWPLWAQEGDLEGAKAFSKEDASLDRLETRANAYL